MKKNIMTAVSADFTWNFTIEPLNLDVGTGLKWEVAARKIGSKSTNTVQQQQKQ